MAIYYDKDGNVIKDARISTRHNTRSQTIVHVLLIVFVLATFLLSLVTLFVVLFNKQIRDFGFGPATSTSDPISSIPTPADTTDDQPTTTTNISPGFQTAANILLASINTSVDPCEDFYRFSCDNYRKNNPLTPGSRYVGSFEDAQIKILDKIIDNINDINSGKSQNPSKTELIMGNVFRHCYNAANSNAHVNHTKAIRGSIIEGLGGFPAVDPEWKSLNTTVFFTTLGMMESIGIPTLFQSYVAVDFENVTRNALYFSQFPAILPLDYYVKPQFLKELENYLEMLIDFVKIYAKAVDSNVTEKQIRNECQDVVRLEVQLALASVPGDLLRNYLQQYNQYNINRLDEVYPSIDWSSYLYGLFGLRRGIDDDTSFIISEPSYFGVLEAMADTVGEFPQRTIVNLVVIRLLMEYSEFIGGEMRAVKLRLNSFIPPSHTTARKPYRPRFPSLGFYGDVTEEHKNARMCTYDLLDMMPHASGYVYLNGVGNRDAVKADVQLQTNLVVESFLEMVSSLHWITPKTLDAVHKKCDNLVQNVGWPEWFDFGNTTTLDEYHERYFLIENLTDYMEIIVSMHRAVQYTENLDLLPKPPNRHTFFGSAATVNAWYMPELNSITFPFGILNSPFYSLDFPQFFNYAGQGGTAGHELSHGFDDEGVQFGPFGELSDCSWNRCGWMDRNSTYGFLDMAQCVVSQYNTQCCPIKEGSVRCANGIITQGENIADLAGEQAAYRAYQKYIDRYRNGRQESRLPGLEQYTPKQLFWMAYANSWCSTTSAEFMVKQILIDPHAPDSCRVNQVVQDIPEFGQDFGCSAGSPMYPTTKDRCPVWIGN